MAEEPIGLRARKKSNRRRAILAAARELAAQAGYATTTVDAIAERAGISGVTVYNYFGSKSGVLLALVTEDEASLCEEIGRRLDEAPDDMVEIVLGFAGAMRRHAGSRFDRELWREVYAAKIVEANTAVGRSYNAFVQRLVALLAERLERARRAGALAADVDTDLLGTALFNVQIVTFVRFVADESQEDATTDSELRAMLLTLAKASR